MIRKALPFDITPIKRIADANKGTLGFVTRPALLLSIEKQWLLVAERERQVIGFVNYRHRRDQQTTLYEMCVAEQYRGQGVGHMLLDALAEEARNLGKSCIQLKAIGGIPANHFYKQYGFTLVAVEPGRKQSLYLWRLEVGTAPRADSGV